MTEVRPMRELAPHLVWEAVLLLAAGAVVAGLYNANSAAFTRGQVWAGIAILGFAACGLALSLRTATPNLAIAPIAVLAGWVFAKQANDGSSVTVAFVVAVLAAAGVGLLLALLAGLTALPAWAVTLGGGFVVSAALLKTTGGRLVPVTGAARATGFGLWATAFAVVSILGAVLFALPAVRRVLTANRPLAGGEDPGRWRPAKLIGALVGLGGSAVLAGVSGVLSTRLTSAAAFTDSGQLPFALAAVLLGGVSVVGRRAGLFGVVLAVFIVDGVRRWQLLEGTDGATTLLTTGVLALVGLLAVWLLELIGRRVAPLSATAAAASQGSFPVAGASGLTTGPAGFPQPGPPPVYGGAFPNASPPVSGPPGFVPPVSGPPGYLPGGVSSPAGVAPQSGIPAQSTGPTSAPPAGYPLPPPSSGPQYGAPPPVGGPGYPPYGGPSSGGPSSGGPSSGGPPYGGPSSGGPPFGGPPFGGGSQAPGGMIPQPWTVPGAGGPAPQVPSQPVSPPVSGPPNSDPPPYPQAPPPSWPPQR